MTAPLHASLSDDERAQLCQRLVVISGRSGSGKTTLARRLRTSLGATLLLSHTSRKPRPGERDGIDYYFTSRTNISALDQAGLLIESTHYDGEMYALSTLEIARALKHDAPAVVVLTVPGRNALAMALQMQPLSLYLHASVGVLQERLRARGFCAEEIRRRVDAGVGACDVNPLDYTFIDALQTPQGVEQSAAAAIRNIRSGDNV